MSVWAVLAAAGSGERLGIDRPKAFAPLGGRPLLATSIERLDASDWIDGIVVAAPLGGSSFPSGHAMMSAIAYLTLATLLARIDRYRRVKALVLALGVTMTLLVGISRIYLGVHWPSDVLAGWCIGAAWAALCWFVALQLQRSGGVEAPDPPPAR